MFIVEIKNNDESTVIHGLTEKLITGKIVKGINAIDSFSFTMLPYNAGFYGINEFTTAVTAFNDRKQRYDFTGRVLYAETTMSEDGNISKSVVCESIAGYLCDSYQGYVKERNWSVVGLLRHLIDTHNAQVEEYKRFQIGTVEVTDPNDNIYLGIQYENTWDSIQEKLIDKLGGELQFRVENGVNYIDYLLQIGEEKTTPIALSKNMKSITREQDPTGYVTRLLPLGSKCMEYVEKTDENGEVVKDENGNVVKEYITTERRMTIDEPERKDIFIDDEEAIALYGIHVGVVIWDDCGLPSRLRKKGEEWMAANNRVRTKYSINYLDLSLLGIDPESVEIGNTYPIQNRLIGVDDKARVIKHTIDICEETKSTIEVGDSLKTLSDIQRDNAAALKNAKETASQMQTNATNSTTQVATDYNAAINATKKELQADYTSLINIASETLQEDYISRIEQLSDSITLEVSGSLGSEASIILSAGANEYSFDMDLSQVRKAFANDNTAISISAGLITFNSGTLVINSGNFKLTSDGTITANAGVVGGWTLKNYKLYAGDGVDIKTVALQAPTENNLYVFAAGGTSHDSYADCPFRVTKAGKLYATDAIVYGDIITIDGSFKTQMDKGSLKLFYDDVLRGTINTKYWSGASTEGISLRVEDGGNYIMFSHADDSQGSGYVVDYYLNAGWSSNYEEMHIFQTSARFLSDAYFAGKTRIRSLRLFDADGEYLVGINNGALTVSKL